MRLNGYPEGELDFKASAFGSLFSHMLHLSPAFFLLTQAAPQTPIDHQLMASKSANLLVLTTLHSPRICAISCILLSGC